MNKELQNYTVNNFYFSKVQRPTSQQSQQRSEEPKRFQETKRSQEPKRLQEPKQVQLKVLAKGTDRNYIKVNNIIHKPAFQIPQQGRQSHLHQLIQKQKITNTNSMQYSQPINNTPEGSYRYNTSPYMQNPPRSYNQPIHALGKGFKSQNPSPQLIKVINVSNQNNTRSISNHKQGYDQLSQSLNGSFELMQRRLKTNQEQLNKIVVQTPSKNRAKSVADEQRQENEMKMMKKTQNQVCKMDSETSFEGYRHDGPRFLTMESQQEIEKILEDFSVKEFLNSKPMSKMMIEHFMNNLNPDQIQQVDQFVKCRKQLYNKKDNKKIIRIGKQ